MWVKDDDLKKSNKEHENLILISKHERFINNTHNEWDQFKWKVKAQDKDYHSMKEPTFGVYDEHRLKAPNFKSL